MHLQNHKIMNTAGRHLFYFLLEKKYGLKFSQAVSWRVHQYDIQSKWDSHKWLSYDLSLEGEKQCYIFLCTTCSAAYNDDEFTKTNFLQNVDTWFCILHITKASPCVCACVHSTLHIPYLPECKIRFVPYIYDINMWGLNSNIKHQSRQCQTRSPSTKPKPALSNRHVRSALF